MFGTDTGKKFKEAWMERAGLPVHPDPILPPARFQYKRIEVTGKHIEEALNQHGKHGWRVAHVDQISLGGTGGSGPYYILLERKVA